MEYPLVFNRIKAGSPQTFFYPSGAAQKNNPVLRDALTA